MASHYLCTLLTPPWFGINVLDPRFQGLNQNWSFHLLYGVCWYFSKFALNHSFHNYFDIQPFCLGC
jgi:hypothetical protein